jgi:predicted transcriptional regulator
MKNHKRVVSTYMEDDLLERIKEQAKKEERNTNSMIVYAIKKYLEEQNK